METTEQVPTLEADIPFLKTDHFVFQATINPDAHLQASHLNNTIKSLSKLREGVDLLRAYAKTKRKAMQLRLNGRIAEAVEVEKKCDRIYGQIPAWAKSW